MAACSARCSGLKCNLDRPASARFATRRPTWTRVQAHPSLPAKSVSGGLYMCGYRMILCYCFCFCVSLFLSAAPCIALNRPADLWVRGGRIWQQLGRRSKMNKTGRGVDWNRILPCVSSVFAILGPPSQRPTPTTPHAASPPPRVRALPPRPASQRRIAELHMVQRLGTREAPGPLPRPHQRCVVPAPLRHRELRPGGVAVRVGARLQPKRRMRYQRCVR